MKNERRVPRNKCWAEGYGCHGKIEKEHVISNGILREFGPLRYGLGKEEVLLGSGSYVTTSLCAKHNRQLSDLDNEAIQFFRAWRNLLHSPSTGEVKEFDGFKIEKWFAKTMVNAIIFRNQAFIEHSSPPLLLSFKDIKRVLFGGESFKSPYGLYTKWPEGPTIRCKYNGMGLLTKQGHLIKADTGRCYAQEVPWGFSAYFHGFTLLSFFNMSSYSNEDAVSKMPFYPHVLETLQQCKYRNFIIAAGQSGFETANTVKLIF